MNNETLHKILTSGFPPPAFLCTEDACTALLQIYPEDFSQIPKSFITPLVCYAAVSGAMTQDAVNCEQCLKSIFSHMPDEMKTQEFYNYVQNTADFVLAMHPERLPDIPDAYKTEENCMAAFEKDTNTIIGIPEKWITPDMCKEAVLANVDILQHLPEKFVTGDLCKAAAEHNYLAMHIMPESMRTDEMYRIAFRAAASEDVLHPISERPEEACVRIKSIMPMVPEHLKDTDFYATVLSTASHCGDDRFVAELMSEIIPDDLKTAEMYETLLQSAPWALHIVPDDRKTEEMCADAFGRNPDAIRGIPDKWITPEMCMQAVQFSAKNLRYIPKDMITPAMCEKAVCSPAGSPGILEAVPPQMRTPALCEAAMARAVETAPYDMGITAAYLYRNVIPANAKTEKIHELAKPFKTKNGLYELITPENIDRMAKKLKDKSIDGRTDGTRGNHTPNSRKKKNNMQGDAFGDMTDR